MLPSVLKGINTSPSIFPSKKILLSCLFIILGRKALVILVISFISFFEKAISAFFKIKSEVKNDCIGKNKSNFDKIILFSLTIISGF